MLRLLRSFLLTLLFFSPAVQAIDEILNPLINAAAYSPACEAAAETRPCPITYAGARLGENDIPPDSPCPCPATGDPGGGYRYGSGLPVQPNEDADFFVDEVLADGFINPVAMAFTDNSNELYVGTREGLIHYVDLSTGTSQVFVDLSAEVGLSGDRGLMDVVAHPNFAEVGHILTMFTVDPDQDDDEEPNSESAADQMLIRLADVGGGVLNPDFRSTLFGGIDPDTGYATGPPLCFNTHAVGTLAFGLDASLFVTTGEGAHWNFDVGDFGQDSNFTIPDDQGAAPSLDYQCVELFGAEQDVGAMRSQIMHSLGGKLLRITPDTGEGVCMGTIAGEGYPVKNPFCDDSAGRSAASRIWALGMRNPFRATVRPLYPGAIYDGGPGVLFFGDVGQGGYEEVNAVAFPGLNFGWPCWEGPMPSPIYRDSPYNADANAETHGCPGEEGPCLPITTIARYPNGDRITCPYMYFNVTTTLPFFYWTRFEEGSDAGYFEENLYTGQEVYGATTAGLQFYSGSRYPPKYINQLFAFEFSDLWIRVIFLDEDNQYQRIQDFAELIYTEPIDGARHTLKAGPDGNICYLTMNGGEVRCFRYVVTNVPPTPNIAMDTDAGLAPLTVQFSSTRTFDRENDPISCTWDFGDGIQSADINPQHTFQVAQEYTVTLECQDVYGNAANTTKTVYANNNRPRPTITSPVPTAPNKVVEVEMSDILHFNATVDDPGDDTWEYRWELQFVHNSHFHPDIQNRNEPSFTVRMSDLPNEGTAERVNLKFVLHVTDPSGLTGQDYIRISPVDWATAFAPHNAPNPAFTYENGYLPIQAGQPVRFNAQDTVDPDGDRIDFHWQFGNGINGTGITTTHTYSEEGDYTVTLNVKDNWGLEDSTATIISVGPLRAIPPAVYPPSGERYNDFNVTMESIQPDAVIRYTLDGSTPDTESDIYDGPILIPFDIYTNTTVKAFAIVDELESSAIITNHYQILPPPCNVMYLAKNCSLVCVNTETPRAPGDLEYIPPANGVNYAGILPDEGSRVRLLIDHLNGVPDSAQNTTRMGLYVDGGVIPGQAIQAKVSYDWTNDGNWDREEMFNLFACNDVADSFEKYTFPFEMRFQEVEGDSYQPLVNGAVMLELWQALGPGDPPITLRTDDAVGEGDDVQFSTISIPYRDTFQSAPTECGLVCNGGAEPDECGVCDGPGVTGCDSQCFSDKIYDECGVCGGVGVTGCDFACGSTLAVDSCGECGGNSTCEAPPDSYSCNRLAIRGDCETPELICSTLNFNSDPITVEIPSAQGDGTENAVPGDPEKIISFEISGITGYYNVESDITGIRGHTIVDFWLDSLAEPGTAVQCQVEYDWTGDGVVDRTEMYSIMTPNDLVNFEQFTYRGLTQAQSETYSNLVADPIGEFDDLVDGIVRIKFWGAYNKFNTTLIRTDNSVPGETSMLIIPFITVYAFNVDNGCGNITIPVTTGVFTTGSVTTGTPSVPPTSSVTTGGTIPSSTADCVSAENCPAPALCHTVACVGGQCLETPSPNVACTVNRPNVDLCYTGVCTDEGSCASTDGITSCDTLSSATRNLAILFLSALGVLLAFC